MKKKNRENAVDKSPKNCQTTPLLCGGFYLQKILFFFIATIPSYRVDTWYTSIVVKGVTTGSTNQKAAYRSRGTNGPISVQQEVM